MNRRAFISLIGAAGAARPLAARAQQVSSVPRIGYLSPGSASSGPLNYYDDFRRELRELGYVEGQNIVIDYRFADGKFDRLPQLAVELVHLNVDVIVSVVTQASLAAKNATRTIPIVIVSVGDPVGAGLVASLARPGANVTGNSSMTIEVIGKFMHTTPPYFWTGAAMEISKIAPILTGEKVVVTISAEKNGKLRVTYSRGNGV
jgi:putative ABC transport system substrate-binding protein